MKEIPTPLEKIQEEPIYLIWVVDTVDMKILEDYLAIMRFNVFFF